MIQSPPIGFLIRGVIAVAVNWKTIVDRLRASSPQQIRLKFYDKKRRKKLEPLIRQLEKMRQEGLDKASLGDREASQVKQLAELGNRFWYQGQLLWGRPAPREAFKSAWCYVLAGECFEYAKVSDLAGRMFHWAAHQFRQLDSLGRAREYYLRSTEIFANLDQCADAVRSLKRAMAISEMIGESGKIVELKKKFEPFLLPGEPIETEDQV